MATEPGDQFAEWLHPQLDPASEPIGEPVQDQPRTPKPDPSQGGHGVPPAAADGVSVFADMLAATEHSPIPGGWYDVRDIATGGPYNQQFKRT